MPAAPSLPRKRLDSLLAACRPAAEKEIPAAELDRLGKAVLRLQRGLTGERDLVGISYMDDPELLGAYLLYYWPVSYVQAARAIELSGLHPRNVLDMGSGPGPMSAAALDAGALATTVIDRSGPALRLAGRLLGTSLAEAVAADLEGEDAVPAGPFDLAIFGHSLNELGAGSPDRLERRASVVKRTAAALSPGGAVLVVDPATLSASRDTLALRDILLAVGWSVLAPCTMQASCPALAAGSNHTCHDEAAWTVPFLVRSLAERAGLDRGAIKMTWMALTPPQPVSSGPGGLVVRPSAPAGAYRVVSEPMLNKAGRIRYLICGAGGRFPLSAKKDDPWAQREGFFSLRRYDLVLVRNPERRENGWGIAPDTRLEFIRDELASATDLG